MSRYSTIELVPGGDWLARATIQDESGQVVNLTDWSVVTAKIEWATDGGGSIDPLTVDFTDAVNGVLILSATNAQTGSVPYGSMSELTFKIDSPTSPDQTFYARINGVPSLTNQAEAIFTIPGTQGPPGVGDKYTVAVFVQGKPAADEQVYRLELETAMTFPVALAGSRASGGAASTGAAVWSLRKGGVEFGTITFTTSATGVFASAAGASFAAGDILQILAPNPQDATLADISITLAGDRVTT